jgi:hypothetical protein
MAAINLYEGDPYGASLTLPTAGLRARYTHTHTHTNKHTIAHDVCCGGLMSGAGVQKRPRFCLLGHSGSKSTLMGTASACMCVRAVPRCSVMPDRLAVACAGRMLVGLGTGHAQG